MKKTTLLLTLSLTLFAVGCGPGDDAGMDEMDAGSGMMESEAAEDEMGEMGDEMGGDEMGGEMGGRAEEMMPDSMMPDSAGGMSGGD